MQSPLVKAELFIISDTARNQFLSQRAARPLEAKARGLERVKGIEPSYSAWKAAALPLSYTRTPGINYHDATAASTSPAPFPYP
jgi:hypothetical protein